MLGAISNPKKIIAVDYSLEQVKIGVGRISKLSNKYKYYKSNNVFNQTTFETMEFASLGVYIDINLSSQNDKKTEVTIEVRRKIGSFDKSHEITNAHQHIDNLLDLLAKGITFSESDLLNYLKQDKEGLNENKKSNKEFNLIMLGVIILLIIFLFVFYPLKN